MSYKEFFIAAYEVLKLFVFSIVAMLILRNYLISPFFVKGASMEPNFFENEYLIVDEITYRFQPEKRGDIVVFRYPQNQKEFFIKRLIGLPGEEVQIKDNNVTIFNEEHPEGFVLDEFYLGEGVSTVAANEERIKVGANEIFVLGDNRNVSKDSRVFGPVNKSFLIGRVLFRGWPFSRVQVFSAPAYSY